MSVTMYTPFQLGGLQIPNRLVASAMFEYGAEQGKITEKVKARYRQLAAGGAGLIITGMHAVSQSAGVGPMMVNTQYEGYLSDLGQIAGEVHAHGSRLLVQLQHCGEKTSPAAGYDRFSVCETPRSIYHTATEEELKQVAANFAVSALRCKEAGADGVQIHAAHGFLLNTFLSPSTNRRADTYGGTIENRARLLLEVYDAVRQAVGTDYIVGVKFPFSDLNEHSILPEESLLVCQELARRGVQFIEVSAGMVMDDSSSSFTPALRRNEQPPFLPYAAQLARQVSVPVISVCGYRTPNVVERALTETKIAAVSFGRPLVCEPNLPNRWKTDPRPAKCVSCNRCRNSFKDGILTCQVEKVQSSSVTSAR